MESLRSGDDKKPRMPIKYHPCPAFICEHPCHLWLKPLFDITLPTCLSNFSKVRPPAGPPEAYLPSAFHLKCHERSESLEPRTKHKEPRTLFAFFTYHLLFALPLFTIHYSLSTPLISTRTFSAFLFPQRSKKSIELNISLPTPYRHKSFNIIILF